MKTFIFSLWLMAAPSIVGAYTFESSIDPIDFFSNYYPVEVHRFNESQAMIMLKSETSVPRYAINFVVASRGQMRIVGYAYIEKGEFHQYILVGNAYKRNDTLPEVKANLKKILEALYEKEKNKEAEKNGEKSPTTPGSYKKQNRKDC